MKIKMIYQMNSAMTDRPSSMIYKVELIAVRIKISRKSAIAPTPIRKSRRLGRALRNRERWQRT